MQQSPDATYAAPSDSHTGELLDELAPSQQDMQQQRQHFTPVPIVPKHILMQLIREWEGPPPTSHDLWHKAERHYGGVFTSRRQVGERQGGGAE